jgi:membrane protein YqaA with SNARE-associated domain
MKIFSKLYAWTMACARHRHASYYLYGLSFAESSFFPIPPDVMLAPMALAKPEKAWTYATFTTISSVLGGVFGYILGMFFFDLIHPYIEQFGYAARYQNAVDWFAVWGFWIIFIAGFSPIPYKVFTVAAGVIGMSLPVFIVASLIGRGGRFFLVSALMRSGGTRMEKLLQSYVDRIGWLIVGLLVLAYLIFRFYPR